MTWTRSRFARLTRVAAFAAAAAAATAALGAASSTQAATLTRYPWVNKLTTESVTIAWQTDVPTDGELQYSDDLVTWQTATDGVTSADHAVTLGGLTADLTYFYKVLAGTDELTTGDDFFITQPTETLPFSFVAFGDIGRATAEQIALAARIEALVPDFGILTGDIIYDAGEAVNFTPQFFDIYRPTIARVPFYTALGNHDIGTSNGQPYLDAFYLPTNSATGTERYYSFDHSNAHFVCLEVVAENTTPDATMLAWLDADLAASPKFWKFVFFHVPAYSNSGGHGGDPTIAAALEPIFQARGVDMVFQGHNHFYTRTYPLVGGAPANETDDPTYTNPDGPIWITTGGGGRALYAVNALSSIEAVSTSAIHVVNVYVVDNVLYLQAVEPDGSLLDVMYLDKTPTTSIAVTGFEARGIPEGVSLRWTRADGGSDGGFHVDRSAFANGPWTRLTASLLVGRGPFEFTDRDAEPGVTYFYRLSLVDAQGREIPSASVSGSRTGPLRFAMGRARPNPAHGATSLSITLERAAQTRVSIVDVQGRLVRTLASRPMTAGDHVMTWDGRDDRGVAASAGLYFAVVRSGGREARTRVALLR